MKNNVELADPLAYGIECEGPYNKLRQIILLNMGARTDQLVRDKPVEFKT